MSNRFRKRMLEALTPGVGEAMALETVNRMESLRKAIMPKVWRRLMPWFCVFIAVQAVLILSNLFGTQTATVSIVLAIPFVVVIRMKAYRISREEVRRILH